MKTGPYIRSCLKWPGGKYRLLQPILSALPKRDFLAEPFAGSGVVFLNADYDQYFINDINPDLIGFYQALKIGGQDFIRYAQTFFTPTANSPQVYYERRALFNAREGDLFYRAALFLYLNRHGYNGLCRYNQKGMHNVPFGRYVRPYFPHSPLLAIGQKLDRVVFSCLHYAEFFRQLPDGGTIYCDPPYAPLTPASFTAYSQQGFGLGDQVALADMAYRLGASGTDVVISNHDTPWVRALYRGAQVATYQVRRTIGAQTRALVGEVLATFSSAYRIPPGWGKRAPVGVKQGY